MTRDDPHGAVAYWSCLSRHADWEGFWMGHPAVRARVNRRVTGDPGAWPIALVRQEVPNRLPLQRALSVGCGTGNFERALVSPGLVDQIVGVDSSATAIARARELASEASVSDRIEYLVGDARQVLQSSRGLSAVMFHASLHHFEDIAGLLAMVRDALCPRGLLYLDEYVGPSRTEWTLRHLASWNMTYRRLPSSVRRTHIVRPPVSVDDPSEMVESSQILPSVAQNFNVIARRDYGGNLLLPIYPSLLRPNQPDGPDSRVFDATVEGLLDAEDRVLARGVPSFHTVLLAERD
jgi:SAM-dependent methyltransferase